MRTPFNGTRDQRTFVRHSPLYSHRQSTPAQSGLESRQSYYGQEQPVAFVCESQNPIYGSRIEVRGAK
jgi:hypothetical protein